MENIVTKVNETVAHIQKICPEQPQIGVILGSGLGPFYEQLQPRTEVAYGDIPNFAASTVSGHAGKLVFGQLEGKSLIVMAGRFHYYEGYQLSQIVFPVRVMARLGVKTLVVTNAAGGINKAFSPGDLMLIDDHINMLGTNPLIGKNLDEFGLRFTDMSTAYTPHLKDLAMQAAANSIDLKRGVYLATTGPTYETPAEIRMMRVMGADAVGMSTIPEVIVARHCGLDIIGISCITNMAAGILNQPLSHEEVYDTAEKAKHKFIKLLSAIIARV